MAEATQAQRLILVTGPSGAGRSTAVAAFEDLGYETIDNLPLSFIPRLMDDPAFQRPIALGLDVRNREFSTHSVIELIDRLNRDPRIQLDILYLDCDPTILIRRYSQTRRRHPLAPQENPTDGIAREIDLLAPIRARADQLIDTTEMSPHDLKAEISSWYDSNGSTRMAISVQSFSYKRGLPRGLDLVFDCRFLQNPYWSEKLRELDGRDAAVQTYVASDSHFQPFVDKITDLLRFVLPAHVTEGKSYLSVGFGCTGGQHRSVTVAEKLADMLAGDGWLVSRRHRELERQKSAGSGQKG